MKRKNILRLCLLVLLVCTIVIFIIILLGKNNVKFKELTNKAGIHRVDDIEYVRFAIGDGWNEELTTYYIDDRKKINKLYELFEKIEYKKDGKRDEREYEGAKLYRITFGQKEEMRSDLTLYGYETDEKNLFQVWPLVDTCYGYVPDVDMGYQYLYTVTNLAEELQAFCEEELEYLTVAKVEEIRKTQEKVDVFDFYGYIHEQIELYNPYTSKADELYQVNRFPLEDGAGYVLMKNQFQTVADEEECRWYNDILSIELYDANGKQEKVLYERN